MAYTFACGITVYFIQHEAIRKKAVTEEALASYYSSLDDLIKQLSAGTARILNMDETGIQEKETTGYKVAGTALTTIAEVIKSDPSPWVTILECINAKGERLTPCVVFTGQNVQGQWFP